MQINRGMWLPDVPDDGNRKIQKIHEICDIVSLGPADVRDIFVVCKTYHVAPNEHYASYFVEKSSMHNQFSIINIGDFLEKHHYPVKVHQIDGEVMFRCKRF